MSDRPRRAVRLLSIGLPVLIAGCSTAQGYEFVRSAGEAKAQCDRARTDAADAACRDRYALSYERYQAERRKVLEGSESPAAPVPR